MGMTTLKSFRLYRSPGVVAPQRHVADYQPEELARFREEFRLVAHRYRLLGRIFFAPFILGFGCLLLSKMFPLFSPWGEGGFFVCWLAIALLILSHLTSPVCPACHNALERVLGGYCPESGAQAIQDGGRSHDTFCSACGKRLWHGKARHYTIRACTHCGVPLDEKGF